MFSCFKRMLQVFYLDVIYVALVIHVCCKCMFQTYVANVLSGCCTYVINVSSVSDVYCNKCFMLQVFHEQAQQRGRRPRWSPWAQRSLRARGKQSGRDNRRGAWSYIHERVTGPNLVHGLILAVYGLFPNQPRIKMPVWSGLVSVGLLRF
jgi:hypothetical protein